MDDKTTKIIKDKFDALPEAIQEVILSSNYEETLLEIGNQYKLNVEQLGILERETTLVMMGLTPTKDFQTELTRELNVDKEKGTQIVQEINEKIFLKIRELLKLMNTPAGEEPSVEEDSPLEEFSVPKAEEGRESTPPSKLSTPQEGNNDTKILNSAGIEIIEKSVASAPSYGAPKEEAHPILAQKLSGYVKNEVVETQHSLDNITKSANTDSVVIKSPKVDPYREMPE